MLGAAGPAVAVGGGGGATGEAAALTGSASLGAAGPGAAGAGGTAGAAAIGSAIGGAVGADGSAGARCSDTLGMGAPATRSSAASRTSTRRNCPPSPTVFTSAAMAMIGKASSSSTSTTKNTSMKPTSPKDAMLQRFPFKRTQDGGRLDSANEHEECGLIPHDGDVSLAR
jgi:pilus assembly protein FimV